MIPSEYGSSAPTAAKVVLQQVRDDEPAALEELRPLECAREQLQLGELHRLVDVLEDAVNVRAGLDELRGEPERFRRRVRVLEAAGVGDETDVERFGDFRRQRNVESRRMSRTISAVDDASVDDQVEVAEPGIVVVVIDVQHELRALDGIRLGADPSFVRAIDREQHALADVGRQRADEPRRGRGSGTRPASARSRSGTSPRPYRAPAARGSPRASTRARHRPGSRASRRGSGRARRSPPRSPVDVSGHRCSARLGRF